MHNPTGEGGQHWKNTVFLSLNVNTLKFTHKPKLLRAVPTVRVRTDISTTLQKRVSDGATCPEMTFHQQYDAVRSGNAPPAT